ncbi:MlaD family protein [Paracoccus lutimaris]|uniref:Phospholipid/cholesterol/gamma-HCH transport system substrate-binding protein n=1 Tax=Paracoccus lutimaris TaxID=1490030 RepID=A0A368YRZ7_9RHOB|nr:MlaD family protein [Paracoccus lutimaris]RCW81687.1 phospholipid/cholesterol/gamma-HCH transport system substrate-binding protein [Paracoccus lutimaris]
METKANFALIGAFTILGFLGLLAFLMWFAKLEMDRQFAYYDIYFNEVSGLGVSSEVTFAGLSVGKVVDMVLTDDDNGVVRVRVEVNEDTPVRENSTAALEIQGVTGVANVAITSGTPNVPLLKREDGRPPVIVGNASVLETLSNEGPQMISRLNTVAEQLTVLLGDDNQTRVRNILANVEHSSANLDKALDDVSGATTAIADAAGDFKAFGDKLGTLSETAETTLNKFTETATNADTTLASATATMDEARGYIAGDLKTLTGNLNDSAATLREELPPLAARLRTTLDNADPLIEITKETMGSAARTFDGADRIINEEIGPVASDLRVTLGKANDAIDTVVTDIPGIIDNIRGAAESADSAFGSLQGMLDGARSHVVAFTRDGLPQYSRLAGDLRSVAENIDALVTSLRRNPSRILSGPKAPEFRR